MKTAPARRRLVVIFLAATFVVLFGERPARATTVVFFSNAQTTNLVASGTTSDTISSEGYLFTFTRDKLFTGAIGLTNPIGRAVRIPWPDGLEAQAVTAGPTPSGARISIQREDGQLFAIESFTARLLANTGGAGAAFEIMPLLNGEDGAPDPFMYNATGYAGSQFTYDTPELAGFDAYQMTLYVDYALMRLTVVDASPAPPSLSVVHVADGLLQLSWPTNGLGYALEFATNLPAQAWSLVTNNVAFDGDLFSVPVDNTGPQRFYRLRK